MFVSWGKDVCVCKGVSEHHAVPFPFSVVQDGKISFLDCQDSGRKVKARGKSRRCAHSYLIYGPPIPSRFPNCLRVAPIRLFRYLIQTFCRTRLNECTQSRLPLHYIQSDTQPSSIVDPELDWWMDKTVQAPPVDAK